MGNDQTESSVNTGDAVVLAEHEVVEQQQTQALLFGKGDATAQLAKATEIANAVTAVIEKKQLYTNISGKKYVWCEGWTTMGALAGVFPHLVGEVKEIKDGTFSATVELKTMFGQSIGRAEAECSTSEGAKFAKRHAAKSMSQTRATSKAFRLSFSWLMVLAGYSPTPAEEMVGADVEDKPDDKYKTAYKRCLDFKGSSDTIVNFYNVGKFRDLPSSVIDEILSIGVTAVLERIKGSTRNEAPAPKKFEIPDPDSKFKYHLFRRTVRNEIEIQKMADKSMVDVYVFDLNTNTCNCMAGKNGKKCKHTIYAQAYLTQEKGGK